MIYYAVQDTKTEKYWTGQERLVSPPLFIFSDDVKTALVSCDRKEMESQMNRAANHERFTIAELDSKDHPWLAD